MCFEQCAPVSPSVIFLVGLALHIFLNFSGGLPLLLNFASPICYSFSNSPFRWHVLAPVPNFVFFRLLCSFLFLKLSCLSNSSVSFEGFVSVSKGLWLPDNSVDPGSRMKTSAGGVGRIQAARRQKTLAKGFAGGGVGAKRTSAGRTRTQGGEGKRP